MSIFQREAVVRYQCPHCRVGLEWSVARWRGWVSCPACGRAGLPPAPRFIVATEPSSRVGAGLRAEQWIAAGDVPAESWPPWSRGLSAHALTKDGHDPAHAKVDVGEYGWMPPGYQPHAANRRRDALKIATGLGLAISLFVLLVSYLDQNTTLSGIAVLIALICGWGRMKLNGRL